MRPVFAAVSSSGGNATGFKELACGEHAATITDPLHEPAGVWFEKCGGWDGQCPVSAAPTEVWDEDEDQQGSGSQVLLDDAAACEPGALNRHGSSEQTHTTLCHSMSTAAAAADALVADAALALQARPTSAVPVPQEPRKLGDSSSFDIPGHRWEVAACVQGPLPPLRPGEGRVLGVTMSAPVYAAFCRANEAFTVAAAKDSSLRQVVPLYEVGQAFTKASLNRIANALQKAVCGAVCVANFQDIKEFPEVVPCHKSLEVFCIPKDDARQGLAAEPGAMGVRVRSGGAGVRAFEVLGIYGGLQLFHEDFGKIQSDMQLAKSLGFRVKEQLNTRFESYAADEGKNVSVMCLPILYFTCLFFYILLYCFSFLCLNIAEHVLFVPETQNEMANTRYAGPVPEATFARDATHNRYRDSKYWLITTAFLYGNLTCLINDPLVDPFGQMPSGSQSHDDLETIAEPNCRMMSCLVRGWPFIVLVSTKAIKPGEELLYLYGGHATSADGYWHILRNAIASENEALKKLDENEKLLRENAEKDEILERQKQELAQKEQEVNALRAMMKLLGAQQKSSGADGGSKDIGGDLGSTAVALEGIPGGAEAPGGVAFACGSILAGSINTAGAAAAKEEAVAEGEQGATSCGGRENPASKRGKRGGQAARRKEEERKRWKKKAASSTPKKKVQRSTEEDRGIKKRRERSRSISRSRSRERRSRSRSRERESGGGGGAYDHRRHRSSQGDPRGPGGRPGPPWRGGEPPAMGPDRGFDSRGPPPPLPLPRGSWAPMSGRGGWGPGRGGGPPYGGPIREDETRDLRVGYQGRGRSPPRRLGGPPPYYSREYSRRRSRSRSWSRSRSRSRSRSKSRSRKDSYRSRDRSITPSPPAAVPAVHDATERPQDENPVVNAATVKVGTKTAADLPPLPAAASAPYQPIKMKMPTFESPKSLAQLRAISQAGKVGLDSPNTAPKNVAKVVEGSENDVASPIVAPAGKWARSGMIHLPYGYKMMPTLPQHSRPIREGWYECLDGGAALALPGDTPEKKKIK